MESDLHPISSHNFILKFADDTNLLVSEHTDVSMTKEMTNVLDWALRNKIVINFSKTKEIVFHRPIPASFQSFLRLVATSPSRITLKLFYVLAVNVFIY
jgi:hypothetical protein